MKFRDIIRVLVDHGFELKRQSGSHRIYEGFVGGLRRVVTVAGHRESDDVLPKTLGSTSANRGCRKTGFGDGRQVAA